MAWGQTWKKDILDKNFSLKFYKVITEDTAYT